MKNILFWLQSSRPGLWFATIWLYVVPTASHTEVFQSPIFWIGIFYVCFPLNLLVYGWNDIVDKEADRINPRKGNYLFGALGSDQQLSQLTAVIIIAQVIFYPIFIYYAGLKMLCILFIQLGILWLYNHPTNGWRSKPPLELTCQIGYLLLVPFSCWLNDVSLLSYWAIGYLSLFAIQSHLIGEVMDITPDSKAGKTTTAVLIGKVKTKILIIFIVFTEIIIIYFHFGDLIFTAMLVGAFFWLILDLFFIFKNKEYSLFQMKLFGYASNALAFASMTYVWWCGFLT